MDETCNLRLQKLELEQHRHKDQLEILEENNKTIMTGLNEINKAMMQAKTAVYTIIAVLLLQNLGLFEFLKMIFA